MTSIQGSAAAKNNGMKSFFLLQMIIFFLFSAGGCLKAGPNYVPPELEVPQNWHQPPDPAVIPTQTEITEWWTVFDDRMMTGLIRQAAQQNLDLRVAVARVNEARARLGVVTGRQSPVVDMTGMASRERSSENLGIPGGSVQTRYSIGLDASWEIDLFGRISRTIEEAAATYQASEEDRNDVLITLYAEVARTYLDIRTFQMRLAAAKNNIEAQKQVLGITKARYTNGLSSQLDVFQAERVLANSEAEVPPLRIELSRSINTMSVLLGKPPGTLHNMLSIAQPIPIPPEKAAVGIPADLLRRRPDIRREERRLAAQTARIGIASADLYPSFSLSGSLNLTALSAADIFNAGSSALAFGPALRWNIFNRDRIRNQIAIEDARTEQALLIYERTVLNALNEVENAMTAFLEQRIQFEAMKRSVAASKNALDLATKRYTDGLTDFQNVLDAQRELFSAENRMAAACGLSATNMVRLYKALGGGWLPGGP